MSTSEAKTAGRKIRVTQVKSTTGFNKNQALVLESLGLRRIRHSIEVPDTPSIRGMIHKIRHLVIVEDSQA